MEKLLKQLFDYQKFEQNPHLEEIISNTENDYGVLLDSSLLAVTGGKANVDNEEERKKMIRDE